MAKWNEYGLKTGTSARDEVLILDSDTNTNKRITVGDIQEFANGKMLEKENSTLSTEAKTLIGAINEVDAKNDAQDEKLATLESDIKEAGTKNTEQDEKISALESDISEAGTKNNEQDERIGAIEKKLPSYLKNTDVDSTLSVAGSPADAKVVGDALKKDKEAITANLEQIATNKKDIGSLKEDIGDLKSVMKDIHNNTPHASTIKDFYNIRRTGKVYQTKIWKFATNPTSSGEKLLDNAGLEFVPSTDTTEGKDDYLNGNHPLFDWVHCNYKRNEDGTAYPIATEYDDTYQETGSADVGAMQMSFWWNWDASNSEYDLVTISDTPNEKYKLKPWTECKRADRTITPWCIGSAYVSGIASDGLLRSQPGLKPERNQSHNNMITNYQKKGKGHLGAGSERNTFQILFNIIKGATKNSQSLFQGCTGYSFQYSASIESADAHTYFPVTNAQAQNILVCSYVSVGYGELKTDTNTVNNDRGVANIHKYADDAKVLKIETLDANNKAVYLDIETGFNTTPIKLSDTVNAPITITSMHWWSGSTDAVIGRHDGSFGSNTDGKHPYRVQGREYAVGGYMVASDTVMDFQSDYSKKVYVAPKGVAHSSSDATIRNTYTCAGTIPANPDGNGSDFWVGDIAVDVDTGAWFPSAKGSSNSQGFADMVDAGGKTTSGMREYLQSGNLWDRSVAGSASVYCGGRLYRTSWSSLGCD